jgi:hypothetical protein
MRFLLLKPADWASLRDRIEQPPFPLSFHVAGPVKSAVSLKTTLISPTVTSPLYGLPPTDATDIEAAFLNVPLCFWSQFLRWVGRLRRRS